MTAKTPTVYAFIDSQNLNLGVSHDVVNERGRKIYEGKHLDWRRFRHYLREKFGVSHAYIFIGYVIGNNKIYEHLQRCGYTLIFKEVVEFVAEDGSTKVKGNVDTDLVLYAAAREFANYDTAVFASGDGDFLSLYQFIDEQGKLGKILVPNRFRYSKLLDRFRDNLVFVSDKTPLLKAKQKTGSSGRISSLGMPGHRDKSSVAKSHPRVKSARPTPRRKGAK
jgi:uncharacterized LabA/DUF88 family protein